MSMFSSNGFRIGAMALVAAFPLAAQKYQITAFYIPPEFHSPIHTDAKGVNIQGEAVGIYGFSEGQASTELGFARLPDGTLQYPIVDPNDFNRNRTFVTGINDSGVISGFYLSIQEDGFLLSNGTFTDISEIQNGNTRVLSINNNGDFCGTFGDQDPPQNGYISIGGNLTQVNVPGFALTSVAGLGLDGASVGYGAAANNFAAVGFVRSPKGGLAKFQAKNANPAFGTFPTGINTQAQLIVGYYYDQLLRVHGFVFHYTGPLDERAALGTVSGSAVAGVAIVDVIDVDAATTGDTYINGVNANGVITGYWQSPQGRRPAFGFIGTPIQ